MASSATNAVPSTTASASASSAPGADSPIGSLLAFLQHEMEQSLRKADEMRQRSAFLKELSQQDQFKQFQDLTKACEEASKNGDPVWSMALTSLKPKLPTGKEWSRQFSDIQNKQVRSLRTMQRSILAPEKLGLCFRTWSDISRSANSCIGSNITDMQVSICVDSQCMPFTHAQIDTTTLINNSFSPWLRKRSHRNSMPTMWSPSLVCAPTISPTRFASWDWPNLRLRARMR